MSGRQWRLYCPECGTGYRKMHTELSGRDRRRLDSTYDADKLAECNNCGNVRPTTDGLVPRSERGDYTGEVTDGR